MAPTFLRLFLRGIGQDKPTPLSVGPTAGFSEDNTKAERPQHPTLKKINQQWDARREEWAEGQASIPSKIPTNVKIVVFIRKDNRVKNNNHMLVEFHSTPLVECLRPKFEGVEALLGSNPSIDARHIYNRRGDLERLISEKPSTATAASSSGVNISTTHLDLEDVKALQLLLDEIKIEFASVIDKLKLLKSHTDEQATWDLLWTFCANGVILETEDIGTGEVMAFQVERWAYKDKSYGKGKESRFVVRGHIVQWTGHRFANVPVKRRVDVFQGSQSFSKLSFRPLSDETLRRLVDRGKKYITYSGIHHLQYDSNIIIGNPDDKNRSAKLFAQGRVMIDVLSYRRGNPDMDEWERNEGSAYNGPTPPASWRKNMSNRDHDVCLLPPAIHGWSFRAKKWGSFLIDELSPIQFNDHAFDHLVLRDDYKKLVLAFAESHSQEYNPSFRDVVAGKGRGIVMLFHGKPGTGKTLTAEAIADYLQLPLYVVSCNEFGVNAKGLEDQLSGMLETAAQWRSVVLIDEADAFLQARNDDVQRSALVSVFLRVLEYHTGFVILTTNRVETFDPAFQSRVNIALKYPDTDQDSRRILWRKFLAMAEAIHVKDDKISPAAWEEEIDRISARPMNGREIKNAVRSAQTLASHSKRALGIEDLRQILLISKEFMQSLPGS